MSCKKNRFNHRKWNKPAKGHHYNNPSIYKRWDKFSSRRFIRSRNRQRIRENRFDLLQPYHVRWGWYW